MQIAKKVFVVTGGGNGIGREVVLGLIAHGARVAAVDLSDSGLAETVQLAAAAEGRLTTHVLNTATSARKALASKARSSRTSMPVEAAGAGAGPGRPRPGQPPSRAWRRSGRGCRSRPGSSAAGWDIRPSPSGTGSGPASSGCGQCPGLSASCSRRRRPCAARRSAPPGCAAGPAARPPPRTGPHRRRPQPAQVPQRLLRRPRHRQARQPGGQLVPHPGVSQPREHPQREQEVHPDPRRQVPQPVLHGPGLLQDVIDQLDGRYRVNSPR